jgi:hypothetical protein
MTMMNEVCGANPAQPPNAREPSDGETAMNEAVVHEHVRDTEHAHSEPDAEGHVAKRARLGSARQHDQRHRDRRVQRRKTVVRFETSLAFDMMRAMDEVEKSMPNSAVEKHRPALHRERDGERHRHDEPEVHSSSEHRR